MGGGLLIEESSPLFDQCTFRSNAADGGGGALRCSNGSSPVFWNCHFIENSAQTGGAAYFAVDCYPEFVDCTFVRNTAEVRGGALAAFDCLPFVRGCTFYQCAAGGEGGTICFWLGTITIERSIIAFGTSGESIFLGVSGEADLSCCDFFGNAAGDWVEPFADQLGINGNLCADPLFCPGADEELLLREDSPCAPFSPPNADCDRIGAWPVGCWLAGQQEAPHALAGLAIMPLGPHPSVGTVRLRYAIPSLLQQESGALVIRDAAGRHVCRLAQGPWTAGIHEAEWNGYDARGRTAAAGVYYGHLQVGRYCRTTTILRIR